MAGFKTHVTTSSVIGVGFGAAAWAIYDVPPPTCVLAAGLCGVSGMLPDLDSGPGVPLRESCAFAAAVIPMLMINRWQLLGYRPETMVLFGAAIYFFIRFGLIKILKKFTVHRGMFHSLPAMIVAGEAAFLICAHEDLGVRYFFAAAVMLGFFSHLVLDEIWSIEFSKLHVKKSFGTAIKFWSDCRWANALTYVLAVALSLWALQDPVWMKNKTNPIESMEHVADRLLEPIRE